MDYLIQKTSIFLLNYFKKIYLTKDLGYQDTNFKSFHYYLPVLKITVSTKQLPCRYSTKKILSLINCDLCDTLLKNQYKAEVLICGHGYYIICYNTIEERWKYCYDYYETEIKHNVKSFITRLEKELIY